MTKLLKDLMYLVIILICFVLVVSFPPLLLLLCYQSSWNRESESGES